MQSETEIILLTSNNMEGYGCKSFIELNKPGCKISLMLLSSDYDFDCFNINDVPQNAIVIFDFDSFKNDMETDGFDGKTYWFFILCDFRRNYGLDCSGREID